MKKWFNYFKDIGNNFISFIKLAGGFAAGFAAIITFLSIFFGLNRAIKYSIYFGVAILVIAIIKQQLTRNLIEDLYRFIKVGLARLRIFKRLKHLEYENYYLMSNLSRIENIKNLNNFSNKQELHNLLVYYNKMGSFKVMRSKLLKDKEKQKVGK